ncbi:MAG TPA: KGG domain-containing protein [Thermoanaerobaculia bacterium]|nr:KGG domain-containing protein [Thermoanaerobaculia bacterium]
MANTSRRGFASMDPSKQREIASKGGKAAHAKGTAHEFSSDEARVAGRKGGETVSRDKAHMSAIGREGGHSRGARARTTQTPSRSSTSDLTREAGDQSFEHQVTTERSAFEPASKSGSSGQQRSGYSSSRNERQGDTPSSNDRFAGREEI